MFLGLGLGGLLFGGLFGFRATRYSRKVALRFEAERGLVTISRRWFLRGGGTETVPLDRLVGARVRVLTTRTSLVLEPVGVVLSESTSPSARALMADWAVRIDALLKGRGGG